MDRRRSAFPYSSHCLNYHTASSSWLSPAAAACRRTVHHHPHPHSQLDHCMTLHTIPALHMTPVHDKDNLVLFQQRMGFSFSSAHNKEDNLVSFQQRMGFSFSSAHNKQDSLFLFQQRMDPVSLLSVNQDGIQTDIDC